MDQAVPKTSMTGPLRPIDKMGLDKLITERKADSSIVKTSKCKTIAEGRFRHLNFIRTFPAYVVDEPPALLGDDTAPNPSEVALAALGSCLAVGIHANATARGITTYRLEIDLEAELNVSCVWGTGNLSSAPGGFNGVRAFVTLDADHPREELEALIAHATNWSPIANTFARPIKLEVKLV